MIPITDRSNPPAHKASSAPTPGRGQRGENRQRMDVALVEHAEDHIDDQDRGDDQHPGEQLIESLCGSAHLLATT
jgi:hypothetical protein